MATPVLGRNTISSGSAHGSIYTDESSVEHTVEGDSYNMSNVEEQYGQYLMDERSSFTESIVTFSSATTGTNIQSAKHEEYSHSPLSQKSQTPKLAEAPSEVIPASMTVSSAENKPHAEGLLLSQEWLQARRKELEEKLLVLQKQKKQRMQDEKASALKLERTLPLDLLARDWFNDNAVSSELRVYLIEKLLPTLVLGMEKLLLEAEKRGLIENDEDPDFTRSRFNPLNLLAQYLMRNNPRYCQLHESSPYVRGLKKVAEDLKRDVYQLEANKLLRLKSQARKKRILMEESEEQRVMEVQERARLLRIQFTQWLLGPEGRLQLQLIQNALYSYLEISSHLATDDEKIAHYSKELEATDETGKALNVDEYVLYIEEYVCQMPMPDFKQLLRHLDQCAVAFRKTFEHEVWKEMFVKLFESLDSEQSGFIDRHRMLHLLEKFYDKLEDDPKQCLHNPRKWPVIELEELDDLYPDSEDEDGSGDETVNVSTEEIGSSEWASVPMSSLAGTQEATESGPSHEEPKPKETVIQDTSEKSPPTEGVEIKPEEVTETGTDEKAADGEVDKIENDAEQLMPELKPEQKYEEDNVSNKVSSAAGEDKPSNPVTPEKPTDNAEQQDQVAASGDVDEKPSEEPVKTPDQESAAETVDKDVAEVNEPEKTDVTDEVTPAVEVKVEDTVGESKEEDEVKEETARDKTDEEPPTQQEDLDNEQKPIEVAQEEAEQEETRKKVGDDAEAAGDINKFLSSTNKLAATLVTPAPSTDESMDVGPVSVQFSKEIPQPPGRKTTSFSTVRKRTTDKDASDVEVTDTEDEAGEKSTEKVQNEISEREKAEDTETVATTLLDVESETILIQHTAEEMRDDVYFPQPVDVKTRPASASRMSVTFAAEPLILPERPSAEFFSHYSSRSQSRMTSVFDESQLSQGRFVSLLENFVTDDTNHITVEQLVNFIHGGYVETEEEKMLRLARARKEALSAKHRQMVDRLFNIWDNDGQGNLDHEEVEDVLSKYKGGMESAALKRGRQAVRQIRKNSPYHDRRRLNKNEFHVYINTVCAEMAGGEEVFDGVIEYLTSTVERTYAERVRGEARRKWLAQIQASAETGGASMESVYRAVFQTLFKDADAHGNQKKVSSYIALLEHNTLYPHRGGVLLRYVATTPDNAPYMLGKAFYEDMRGISFYAVRRGKMVHVPRVQSHGRIYFWNTDRQEGEREGSLVLVPLRDVKRRTYGLIGIDNIDNAPGADRSIFASHETSFYQGVAKTFSWAFHHVDLRRKLLRIIDAAMSWVHSRAPKVRTIVIYFVEPDPKGQANHVLRKMMTADNNKGVTTAHARPTRLYRKDNLFRDYLFKCVDNSETTSADAYGERHTAYPLRDDSGRCQCVIDISIGVLRNLPSHEYREVQRMLKLLQAANREVMKESTGGEKTVVLEAEERASDETRVDIMFDRLMLTDLRENVSKLDNSLFAELKNYQVPPVMIHNILKAVLHLFHHDREMHAEFEDWVKCKQMLTARLRQQIVTYDPTSDKENGDGEENTEAIVQNVGALLKGIAHGAVAKHGSRPAQQLYNWAFVCLSLIEHARKMRQNEGQPAVTPVTSASTNLTTESGADLGCGESI
uniref:EF-hand calcium-binding domain-containing protein 5-like n=1 Tax=Phallusia mammillata TaxID=59560 RepID=A0A6F9DCE4_9ASCI|nr:EF-hand calcium-binding domain-containing protein 5-like [Phallusia mammillata]